MRRKSQSQKWNSRKGALKSEQGVWHSAFGALERSQVCWRIDGDRFLFELQDGNEALTWSYASATALCNAGGYRRTHLIALLIDVLMCVIAIIEKKFNESASAALVSMF